MRVSHRLLLVVVCLIGAAAVVGIALLWPGAVELEEVPEGVQTTRLVDALLDEVVTIGEDELGLLPGATIVEITARIDETGELTTFQMVDDTGDTFQTGQRVRLQEILGADDQTTYLVSDFRRGGPLVVLTLLFVAAVLALGRFQGARALLGLVLTFVIIIGFIIPAILDGRSPVTVALFGSVAIMIITLYLSHGFSPKTTAAVVGTAGALLLTGLLAVAFVSAAQITGFTSDEARLANLQVGGLSLRGLLLAGIIIGGLGVLDDVTMSQASTVFELRRANPAAQFTDLFRGALNVGRDHIAATVNTLFLAYAGAALPLLILFAVGIDPLGTVLTSEIVAVEVVRTLVGSIGLIAAVPLTTALAAAVVVGGSATGPARAPDGTEARGEPQVEVEGTTPDDEPVAWGESREGGSGEGSGGGPEEEAWVERLREAYRLPDED